MLLEQPNFYLGSLPDGEAGTWETLGVMAEIAKHYKTHPAIRLLSLDIISDLPGKDFAGEARRIFEWVRENIRYVMDVNEVETIHTPDVLLRLRQGDCDDMATLLAAMLESVGHPARFVAVGPMPGAFEHVYVETRIANAWIAADPTEPHDFGWKPSGMFARMVRYVK